MRFYVLIKPVSIHDHLIAKDLMVATEINAVTLRLRERERELIEVEARELTGGRPDTRIRVIEIRACRSQSVSTRRCTRKFSPSRIQILSTSGCRHIAAKLKIIRTGIRA